MATLGPMVQSVNSSKVVQKQGSGSLVAVLIIGLFTLVFFRSVILNPAGMIYSPLSDLVGQTFGWKVLIRDTLWNGGSLALWNPHLMCGYPILGNLNYALLFPMHLLYLLLPAGPAASWTYLLTHFLAALAAWYFLRVIGVRNWGAIIGGLAYGFGVRNMGHLTNGFVGHLETLPFLPLAFAFTARLADRRTWYYAAALAVSLAVILFSSFAQIFLYLMFILPFYFAWLVWSGEYRQRWLLSGWQFSAAVVLACGLAAVHLLPAIQLLPELSRSGDLAPELYRLGSLPLRHFFTLINPELFGRIGPEWSYFGSAYFWTLAFYTPILLLPLAVLSFCDPGGRRHRTFFLALIPFLFLFAMGTYGPIYDFCHRFIPGVKLFREPARILFFHPLAMAVLAGFGWNGLRRLMNREGAGESRKALVLLSGAALLVGLLAAGYAVYHGGAKETMTRSFEASSIFFKGGEGLAPDYAENLDQLLPLTTQVSAALFSGSLALLLAAVLGRSRLNSDSLKGIAMGILLVDLLFFGRGYLQTADSGELFLKENPLVEHLLLLKGQEPPFRVADLSGALSDNLACAFGIDKVGGYDPINLRATQRRFDLINRREDQSSAAWTLRVAPGFRRELLDQLNARYLVTRLPLNQDGLELVKDFAPFPVTLQNYGTTRFPDVRIYLNHHALPRAWIVPGFTPPEPGDVSIPDLTLPDTSSYPILPATIISREPNQLVVEAEFQGAGLLVISQAWSGGWRAEDADTGEALPLHRADGMLVAVPVNVGAPGHRRIRLCYRPVGLRAGMLLSTISLLAIIGLLTAGRFFRRPPAQSTERRPVEEESKDDKHEFVHKGERVQADQVEHQEQVHGDGQRVKDA